MNPGNDDVSVHSLLAELLDELGMSRTSLARYEILFRILWNVVRLLVGIFSIINTVFSFIDGINPVVKQVFLIINLVIASGLLGNFEGKAVKANSGKKNIDTVKKILLVSQARLGPRQVPQPLIIDMLSDGPPLPQFGPRMATIPVALNNSLILSELIKDPRLKTAIIRVEAMLARFN